MNNQNDHDRRRALRVVYLVTVGAIGGLFCGGAIIGQLHFDPQMQTLALIGWSCAWLSGLAYLCVHLEGVAWSGLRWASPMLLLSGLLVGAAGMPLASWVAGTVRTLMNGPAQNPQLSYIVVEGAPFWMTILIGVMVVFLQPLAEEVLYRGVVYSALESAWGSYTAVLASTLLFGIMHGEVSVIAGTMSLGLFFGILRAKSDSIVPAYLAHMTNNGIAFAIVHVG